MRYFLVSCLLFILSLSPVAAQEYTFQSDVPDDELALWLVNNMNDSELLGQVLLFGYEGTTPSPAILNFISNNNLGGVKIFGWNTGSLSALAGSVSLMQRRAQESNRFQIPLFIVTDQEGGWVRHIRAGTSQTPGNMSIGATGLPTDAYNTGYYIGLELRALGINMNFAPTVDVYNSPDAHVIGSRSFSSDPVQTGVLATAYFKGMQAAGIICTAKHFPGHGSADLDSHIFLPVIEQTLDEWWENDLLPYRFLMREGIPAIMSSHLAYPNITSNNEPASLNRYFLHQIIREDLGFQGIVVTDDMIMESVQRLGFDAPALIRLALEAGNDLVLLSRTSQAQAWVFRELLALMADDSDFHERVKIAADRVLRVKLAYLKDEDAVPLYPAPDSIAETIPNPEAQDFFFDQSYRAVSAIRSENIPFSPADYGRVLLVSQYGNFFTASSSFFPQAERLFFSYLPFYSAIDEELAVLRAYASRSYDLIIFCLANPNSLQMLRALENTGARVVVISALTPVNLSDVLWVEDVIAVYGTTTDSFSAGFAALLGQFSPEGRVPIEID